jgi:diaminopimelate decarboxylase
MSVEQSRFLNKGVVRAVKDIVGTPAYVYDKATLTAQARKALQFPDLYGLKVRFAMKACPNAAILKLFNGMGICFDASSGFEVRRLMLAGVRPTSISLSSQELPTNLRELVELGIDFNACSLHQLQSFGKLFPGAKCGIRFNPGQGSGGTGKTVTCGTRRNHRTRSLRLPITFPTQNVGGPDASFGVWHDLLPEVKSIVQEHNLTIERIHTHIGSGSDPDVWQTVSMLSLDLVREFPTVVSLNLGGGFKVGRMSYEKSTDLQLVGEPVKQAFKAFAEATGREIKLEIEPGTFLVANAGVMVSTIQDIVSTGPSGHTFLKLDSGMTEVLRPSL